MKIRLVQAGYENFTGEMGHIDFVDGASVHDVAPDFARALGGIVRLEVVAEQATPAPAPAPTAPATVPTATVPTETLQEKVSELVHELEEAVGLEGAAK